MNCAVVAPPNYPMNRSRGRFVARRPSRLGQIKSRGVSLAADRFLGTSPSVAAAKLPREGGAAGAARRLLEGRWAESGSVISSGALHGV